MTTATLPRTVPATGLAYAAGEVVIRLFRTPQAGLLIQARSHERMLPEWCSRHDSDSAALRRYAELVAVCAAPD